MSGKDADMITHSAEKAREWVNDLAAELGSPGDQRYALRVLRSFLHALRDRLPVEEAAHFSAQLPEFVRGVFFEGWRPSVTPARYHDLDTFLEHVARAGSLAGETEAAFGAEATARLLAHRLGGGELDKIRGVLPHEIAEFLEPGRLLAAREARNRVAEEVHDVRT